jgi:putative tRNA adenosine deaminase-associated protein
VPYFAAGLTRSAAGWRGEEVDLSDVEDLDAVTDLLRDLAGDDDDVVLLLVEENDEYLAIVRVESDGDPRVFLSDVRAVDTSDIAAAIYDGAPVATDDDEESDSGKSTAEAVGDAALLADLGTPEDDLLELCAEEGLLPADVLTTVCERAGCADVLDALREG